MTQFPSNPTCNGISLFFKSGPAQFPLNPSCNFAFFEFRTYMPTMHPNRHAILLVWKSRGAQIPSNPTSYFNVLETKTCPIPIKPNTQFRFLWNVHLPDSHQIQYEISLLLKSRLSINSDMQFRLPRRNPTKLRENVFSRGFCPYGLWLTASGERKAEGLYPATPLMTHTMDLGLSIRLSMFELHETGDWDIFRPHPTIVHTN